jgi:hypothetical protein
MKKKFCKHSNEYFLVGRKISEMCEIFRASNQVEKKKFIQTIDFNNFYLISTELEERDEDTV